MTVDLKCVRPIGSNGFGMEDASRQISPRQAFDFPSYLIDVSIVILKAIRFDLTRKHELHDVYLNAFIAHVFQTSKLSYSVLLSGLLYLLRFHYVVSKNGRRLSSLLTIDTPILTYCLFLGSVMVSSKLLNDQGASNRRWASYTGLPLSFVNQAEMAILEAIEYKINVNKAVFDEWVKFLFRSEHLAAYKNSHMTPSDASILDEFSRPPSSTGVVPSYRSESDSHSDSIADILLEFSNPRPPSSKDHHQSLYC